jgi:hypothetical protein
VSVTGSVLPVTGSGDDGRGGTVSGRNFLIVWAMFVGMFLLGFLVGVNW